MRPKEKKNVAPRKEGDSEGITRDDPKADGFVGVLEGDRDLLRLQHDKRRGVKSAVMAALQPVLQAASQFCRQCSRGEAGAKRR